MKKTDKNNSSQITRKRCAVYTRKSTTENLDSSFTSLDAQRESCEAFISSQKLNGWVLVTDHYDDGGFSGGDMDRPAFQQLMLDIADGKIDCVVVYKVDRLSRSLADFIRIVQKFEEYDVGFVSITQSFDTGTSMGRLMLNVLLSFAQFEREIISERTRDKITAAKKKGKWVGGYPILGYDINSDTHSLVVNENEAVQVREIYDLYLKNKSMGITANELQQRKWMTKSWITKSGNVVKGEIFDKSRLHRLLTNIAYIGKVKHHDDIYEGEHQAIVSEEIWNRVQETLAENRRTGGSSARKKHGSLLSEILVCGACGTPMIHSFTRRKNKSYRYYICQTAHKNGRHACPTKNLPAAEIEKFVFERIKEIGKSPELIEATIARVKRDFQKQMDLLNIEIARLQKEIGEMGSESERLKEELPKAEDEKRNGMKKQISEIRRAVSGKRRLLDEKNAALAEVERKSVCEEDVKESLAVFDPVWDVLYPQEQSRVAAMLIEKVVYDEPNDRISVTFHPDGMKNLAQELKAGM
jgi:site-specific DNA recombinase